MQEEAQKETGMPQLCQHPREEFGLIPTYSWLPAGPILSSPSMTQSSPRQLLAVSWSWGLGTKYSPGSVGQEAAGSLLWICGKLGVDSNLYAEPLG